MAEIPSDQDGWIGDIDHDAVYEEAGLETGGGDGGDTDGESAKSLARRLFERLS